MSKTLLDGVNEILKRTSLIAGDAQPLTSLTDSSRQVSIDLAKQVINEGIDELFSVTPGARPREQKEATITLATGQRAYPLATDLVQMHWPMIDRVNNQYIEQYAGSYNEMLVDDPEQDDTGLPYCAAINPVNGALHMDRAPTVEFNGRVYTYQYHKDVGLVAATDQMPFGDAVFRAMVPVWVQLFRRDKQRDFDNELYKLNVGRASRMLPMIPARTDYCPR